MSTADFDLVANWIAHHEPVHRRDLSRDHADLLELAGWICEDCHAWIATNSRTLAVLAVRPNVTATDVVAA